MKTKTGKTLLLCVLVAAVSSLSVTGKSFRIKGRTVDTLRRPISGVLISVVNNPRKYVLSNKKGTFSIRVKTTDTLLILPPWGENEIFLTKVSSQKKEIVFILKPSGKSMVFNDKIIHAVNGLQRERMQDFVKQLKNPPAKYYVFIYELIREKYPQIQIDRSTGELFVRGMNNLNGNFPILIIVDGVKDVKLTTVDPNDVKSMHLVSDGKTSMYGDRAAGGVLEIFTKTGK